MTDDDIRLGIDELHDSILGWAHETAHGYTLDGYTLDGSRARRVLEDVADSLRTMPPGWHEEWADYVEDSRPYIDRAIDLLRVAQHDDPADAAAALRDYLAETA